MPYVIVLDPNSGKQVPYWVTREQYRYQARTAAANVLRTIKTT